MIIDFLKSVKDFNLKIKGILQIGANVGQEVSLFSGNGYKTIYVEPLNSAFAQLEIAVANYKNAKAIKELISDGELKKFNLATFDQCSSVYNTPLQKEQGVQMYSSEEIQSIKLNDIFKKYNLKEEEYNTLVIDVEGSELDIFRNADLKHFKYIYVEYNVAYENTKQALIDYLLPFGYISLASATCDQYDRYGDILFMK